MWWAEYVSDGACDVRGEGCNGWRWDGVCGGYVDTGAGKVNFLTVIAFLPLNRLFLFKL